jgi:MFS family permease
VLFRHRAFQRYFLARVCAEFGFQILVVAIGWQVYALTHSALALGLVGLAGFVPAVVPPDMLSRGAAIVGGAWQSAAIGGPAVGGILYAIGPVVPYAALAALMLVACVLNGLVPIAPVERAGEPASLKTLFAGVGFVRSQPSILGTISLDLFAVLLGGATALLPIYARDILHTGPWGLGLLRGAPAVGALAMTAFLAYLPLAHRAGIRMFQGVIVFGAATIVFALSQAFWLSLVALFVMGAGDTISVVVRTSLVQLLTPDGMRGRVSAVNGLFINASSQLGEFESGVTAALLGAVPAAALGGLGTIVVAVLWMRLFPALRNVDRLEA